MSGFRLPGEGALDRGRELDFRFDGRDFRGYHGDTLASALLASGVTLFGRSFKYHRPRGLLTAGSEEPNALVELRSGPRCEPNTRATVTELYAGLEARSQNRWPSLHFDLRAVNGWFSPVFVAGFYYKTFMWPRGFWEKLYEPAIRRAAGLGRATHEPDPDRYEKVHGFCDVLVIGAGPAGMSAALGAARSGARVIVCDEDHAPGGQLHGEQREIDGQPGIRWVRETWASLEAIAGVTLLSRTTVFGVFDGGTYAALERVSDHLPSPAPSQPRQRYWKIVARRTVLATGAIERPLLFPGNDCPGVMLGSAVRTYASRFRVAAGRSVAVLTSVDDGWRTAFQLAGEGIAEVAVVDVRASVPASLLVEAERHGIATHAGTGVQSVSGGKGVRVLQLVGPDGRSTTLRADVVAMSGGWNPNVALTTHLGDRPRWSAQLGAFVPGKMPAGMTAAGASSGDYSLQGALSGGYAAGSRAAVELGFPSPGPVHWHTDAEQLASGPVWLGAARGKAFVDFQHDVTARDIEIAASEGFRSAELLKRYTTLGMATDQGKTSALNGHALIAALTQRDTAELGTITARPPYTPVAIGALAGAHRGQHFRPVRRTPSHQWAQELRAQFVESGEWLRAQWFSAPGENDWFTSVCREVRAVRGAAGVCDVSTLGKVDLQGSDAAAFLDAVYCNTMSTLPVGKVRYGLMLREDGMVFDDGTLARFAAHRFVLSTTTANAARVMQHLEYARQVLWPQLDVQLAPVSEAWAQFAIAGPCAREVLGRLLGDSLDVSNEQLPYLACREFWWRSAPARVFRVSFSGELAYELAVPARHGDAVVRRIMSAGADCGIQAYGTEALGVLRIEKGHVAGNELLGTTTPGDLGLGKLMSRRKDFIGATLSARAGLTDPDRPVLVGVRPMDQRRRLFAGAHFLNPGVKPSLEQDQGFLSSVAYSPSQGSWIGLGFLRRGRERLGDLVIAHDPVRSGDTEVQIVDPCFYDPNGERVRQ